MAFLYLFPIIYEINSFTHWEPLAFAILIYLENPRLLIAMEFEPHARGVNVHDTYLGEGDL